MPLGLGLGLGLEFEMYPSKISHCVHCAEYSTDGGGSVIVPRSRSPLLSVCVWHRGAVR